MRRHVIGWSIAAVAALVLSACGQTGSPDGSEPGQTRASYAVNSSAEVSGSPTWTAAKKAGTVRIGVFHDQPGIGNLTPGAKEPVGFDVDIATIVAGGLGFSSDEITWVDTVTANRDTFLQQGNVDLVVAGYTINDERKRIVDFAGPYYRTGQDLLVNADSDISGPDDLDGKKVCATVGGVPGQRIAEKHPKAELVTYDTVSKCVTDLSSGSVDAVTTDDAILRGYAAANGEGMRVVGAPFSEDHYGIGLPKGDDALREAINDVLQGASDDGDWSKAFDANLGSSAGQAMPEVDRY